MVKKIAAVVLLIIVVSLSFAGCTSSTTNPSSSGSVVPPSEDMAKSLTDGVSKNFIVVTPFSKSTNAKGNVIYTATVKDKSDKLNQFQRTITYELVGDAQTARVRFNETVKSFQTKNYVKYMESDAWRNGFYGSARDATLDTAKQRVSIYIAEPGSFSVGLAAAYPYGFNSFGIFTSEDVKLV